MFHLDYHTFIFVLFAVFRVASVFVIRTSFVPDEYWQSLEVAHKLTFGYGYWTWEWTKKIRSCTYPLVFHIIYSIFPSSIFTCTELPKIFQGLLSAVGDFYTFKLSLKLFGPQCAEWTVFNIVSSWFLFYCSSRTITNMAETSLTMIGFYHYPLLRHKQMRLRCYYLWFAAASVLIRPTAIVTWIPLCVYHAFREQDLLYLFRKTLLIVITSIAFLLICDWWCYDEWVFTPLNFFKFNWSFDIGAFYGTHNVAWYLTTGIPVILSLQIVPFLLGMTLSALRPVYLLIIWVIIVFSIPSHKEFRFLLPIIPISLIMCSVVMNEISEGRMYVSDYRIPRNITLFLASAILIINVPLSLYTCMTHQRGTISAMKYLSSNVDKNSSVLFLMPCHSTPYYSYIHQDIPMRFLTCEPSFNDTTNYMDEADSFFENPRKWLQMHYPPNSTQLLPTHVILFDTLYQWIAEFLHQNDFSQCFKAFHTHFAERRTGKYVYVFCRNFM